MPAFKVGPSTDSWGTPKVTTLGEEKESSTTTRCERLLKNDLIHSDNLPLIL